MIEPEISKPPLINQVALLAMGALILFLVVDFGRQVVLSRQRHVDHRHVDEQGAAAQQEVRELEDELEWSESDQAVHDYARRVGLHQENEIGIELIEGAPPPIPTEETPPALPERTSSPREEWWDLFFGER